MVHRGRRVLLGLVGLEIAGAPAPARAADIAPVLPDVVARRLDAAIGRALVEHNLPSVAVEVGMAGRGSYRFVGATAGLAGGARRTAAQPFRLASLTKTFTATAVPLLVDRFRLGKTDPISLWFRDFPNAAKITVDDLILGGIVERVSGQKLGTFISENIVRN